MKVYAVYMHDYTGDHQIRVFKSEEERQEYIDRDVSTVTEILLSDGYEPNLMSLIDKQEVYAAGGEIYYEWICDETEFQDREEKHQSISFRQMTYREVAQLKCGDKIKINVCNNFYDAIVVRPMFWNSAADEPDWEVETTNGFVDVYSIYRIDKI